MRSIDEHVRLLFGPWDSNVAQPTMTPTQHRMLDKMVRLALEEAIEDEREACATEALSFGDDNVGDAPTARLIAARIRSRMDTCESDQRAPKENEST